MDANRIDAIVATAFNIAAADEPSLRSVYPSGMSPAIAKALPKSVKAGWIESYLVRLHAGKLTKHEPLLYGAVDGQAALDLLESA